MIGFYTRLLTFVMLLAMSTAPYISAAESGEQQDTKPLDGALIIPGEDDSDKSEKKCMTVCQKWGENCVINPRTGNRKCRRICKQFGEECF